MSANFQTPSYNPSLKVKASAELERRRRAEAQAIKWIPQEPTARQKQFLDLPHLEAFFGGSAGPGKSSALLMAALEYVDAPGYAALLLRKTYQDLAKPGALMDRAHQWLRGTSARWNEQKKQWTFPSSATLTFGYLENDNDRYQYQSSEFSFIGWDELTQHKENNYSYLFSRLRRLANAAVPLRMRSASNPGGVGAEWVRARFIPDDFTPDEARQMRVIYKRGINGEGSEVERAFVPATLDDNPYLDRAQYIQSLNELDAVTREQLLRGDWQIRERGNIYPMWDEDYHVIGWDDFARIYGVKQIPEHWRLGCGQDWGWTSDHPCVTVWVARAAENSPLAGSVFVYRTLTTYGKTAREIAKEINLRMAQHHEKDRCEMWLMSHEAASERAEYAREHALPFSAWEAGPNTGIAQVRDCLEITHRDEPHPFRPHLRGRPALYCVVADDQLIHARDDHGMARLRSEISAYKYYQPKSGEGSLQVRPQPLFNDTMDALKGLARRWFPSLAQLTKKERIEVALPEPLRLDALQKATASDHSGIYYARKDAIMEAERRDGRGAKNYSAVARYRDIKRKRGW